MPIKSDRKFLIAALLVYAVLGLLFFRFFQYKLFADSTSYISLAQKYLAGDLENVVTGHWGPLFSWLLVPFLYFGLAPLLGAKLLALIVGVLTIIGVRNLSYRFDMSQTIRIAILFSLIPILLYFSFTLVTPDLLLTCLLLYYLNFIFDTNYSKTSRNGILCGCIGGFAYLCKHYALPFFLGHFFVLNVLQYLRSKNKVHRKKVLQNYIFGVSIFLIISSFWITVLSREFKEFTIGTSGRYVHELYGPDSLGELAGPNGFQPVPNDTAFSAWENPSIFKGNPWSPLGSLKNIKHQIKISSENFYILVTNLLFSPLSMAVIFAYIVLCMSPLKSIVHGNAICPLITIISFPAGYLLISHVEERFFWMMDLLLLLMGGHLLNHLINKFSLKATQKYAALTLLILSFITMPMVNLLKEVNSGKDIFVLSQKLKDQYKLVNANTAAHNRFRLPLYLSFYLNCRFHGTAQKNISEDSLVQQLKDYQIDYYFFWNNSGNNNQNEPEFLKEYIDITRGEIPGLKIYDLKPLQEKS